MMKSFLLNVLFALFVCSTLQAQPLIRDAEIEETIALYAQPLFKAAGLNEQAIDVFIVNDERLNAFVSNGQKIFMHTGLLMESTTPEAVMGVIAHEAGHIAGGHLAKLRSKVDELSTASILGYILGAAAAAGGAGDAAIAILTGGQHLGQRTLLAHTRGQERAADSFAITTLAKVELSPAGLKEILSTLEQQNLWQPSGQDNPYARSHPLTTERLAFVEDQLTKSPYRDKTVPISLQQRHDRMRGKLYGFIKGMPTGQVFEDAPIAKQYATAIAAYKQGDFYTGDAELEKLMQQFPNDAYLYEVKGQLYFENGGDAEETVQAYREAVQLRPNVVSLKQGLARILSAQNQPEEAAEYLQQVVQRERRNSRAWSELANAYGQMGNELQALLASAEASLIQGNTGQTSSFLSRAKPLLKNADGKTKLHYDDLKKAVSIQNK